MVNLALSWFSFIIFVSLFPELVQLQYLLYSSCMFWFTYLYNCIFCVRIPSHFVFLSLAIPTTLFWYVAFVYNDFLSLTPMKYETFFGFLFFSLYVLTYIVYKTADPTNHSGQKNDI